MPPGRSSVHAPPPLSPVVNNHQSNRSAAPGMPPNMYPVNSIPSHRSTYGIAIACGISHHTLKVREFIKLI